ncbi:cellulose binding domain-containing protein [Antribacter gilvus]|uniref:cellulose binding domain-containing protein n=1 Tax=Antribacter gilvus TaxID=2304675 RepID=UPI000F77EA96|nr:cellulose binding domain-containing protein [Antribacter gilvus]
MRFRPALATLAGFGLVASGLGVAAAVAATPSATSTATAATTDYEWGNVEIVGGGFVPGLVYSQGESGLVYARTDVGGAYRLDPATQRWVPLLDHVGWGDWGHSGVLSIAADPVNTNKVYAAVGSYTNSWDPNNGAILRSSDRGETWQKTGLPFKVGGNMPGRGMGERLMVDPNDNRVVYFGTEGGNGLWRSTDSGVTWSKVASFPNPGNYVQDPADPNGYLTSNQGVVWVVFDPRTGSAGSRTQTIYVGVADKENNVYRSTNGGATWQRVPGQPTGFIPHKAVLDDEGGQLYVATSDTGGPYDGGKGDVWRLDTATGVWTQISPVPSSSSDAYFGYSGLTIDRQDPDTLMVVSQISWFPDIQVFRSTDRGATWTQIWDWAGYPSRTLRYSLDTAGSPWLDFGKQATPPETSPKLGWMTEAFEIDPFNSNKFMYGTGATIYGGSNLTAWDTGGTVNISVKAQGLEETAVQDLAAPPGAVDLVSGMYDIGGFVHDDINTVPSKYHYSQPYHGGVLSVDFAELAPATMVRAGNGGDTDSHLGVSTSNGGSWWAAQQPAGVTGAGTVAVNADGSRILWSPEGAGVHVSTTLGSSWTASTGVPAGAKVEADRQDPQTFYAFHQGTFYRSTNGGASFTASSAAGLPASGPVKFAAVPGRAGDVWLAGGETDGTYGMWRSTDRGATFTKFAAVQEGDVVGFGKAAPGRTYPAVYTSSKIGGVRGIFRSDDAGATWVRINDDEHQFAWTGNAITGDPDVYGRVYLGTNGRGIVVGDFTGTAPSPTASPMPSVSPSPSVTPTPTDYPSLPNPTESPTAGPTPAPVISCTATFKQTGSWPGGFQGEVTVKNTGTTAVQAWRLAWTFGAGTTIQSAWGADVTQTGTSVLAKAPSWAQNLAPGASATIGFVGGTSGTPAASGFTLNGKVC